LFFWNGIRTEKLNMPDLNFIRAEIERRRAQVGRQRREILALQKAGIATASAEALLVRMLDRIDELCAERDRLKAAPQPTSRNQALQNRVLQNKVLGGRR
jgi:hypothetical protein